MKAPLGALSIQDFLDDYWQTKPCLIRGALENFESPLDADDLAGLACESLAESRIIQGPDSAGHWQLSHGPFEESIFDQLGDQDWTLLVQDVEKHYPPLKTLLHRFGFIPSWRRDDLMMSFAAPGGSVGAHVDQYDVFLLQGAGRRRWSIAQSFTRTLRNDVPVDMLMNFEPEQSWVLEPGDMLYLPPNVAHHGVALEACLTLSVGFRAPSTADLALALGEWLGERNQESRHFQDRRESLPSRREGLVDSEAATQFQTLLTDAIGEKAFRETFLPMFLSRYRQGHEPVAADQIPGAEAFRSSLKEGHQLVAHPWSRFCWVQTASGATLFASGHSHNCEESRAEQVCNSDQTPLRFDAADPETLELWYSLFSQGQLLMVSRTEDPSSSFS